MATNGPARRHSRMATTWVMDWACPRPGSPRGRAAHAERDGCVLRPTVRSSQPLARRVPRRLSRLGSGALGRACGVPACAWRTGCCAPRGHGSVSNKHTYYAQYMYISACMLIRIQWYPILNAGSTNQQGPVVPFGEIKYVLLLVGPVPWTLLDLSKLT
jgi:hypothetical protein